MPGRRWNGPGLLASISSIILPIAGAGAQDNAMNSLPCLPDTEAVEVMTTFWQRENYTTAGGVETSLLIAIDALVLGANPVSATFVRAAGEGPAHSIAFRLPGPPDRYAAAIRAAFGPECAAGQSCTVDRPGEPGSLQRMRSQPADGAIELVCVYRQTR